GILADRDAFDELSGGGVDDVDLCVVAAGDPELGAVVGEVAHVGAAAAGYWPVGFDFVGGEVDHGDGALRFAFEGAGCRDGVGAAVGDVALGGVATGVEAVGADA